MILIIPTLQMGQLMNPKPILGPLHLEDSTALGIMVNHYQLDKHL